MSKKEKKTNAKSAPQETTPEAPPEDNPTVNEQETQAQPTETQLNDALKQEKDKFLRLFAEFENYKRRTSKERIALFSTASEDVIKTLLPILDDFERALNHIEDGDKSQEGLLEGVSLIHQKLVSTLEKKDLKVMDIEKGTPFNADNHEAVTQIPAPTEDLKGKVVDVVQKGYTLGDKIIRFPKVVIGQ